MADKVLPIAPVCVNPAVWLFEIPVEQFAKTREHPTTTYTGTVKLDSPHIRKYCGILPTFWKVSVYTYQTPSSSGYKVEPTCEKELLASERTLRVECAISASGLHFGNSHDVIISPEGWASPSTTGATASGIALDQLYDIHYRSNYCVIRHGTVIYVRLAFYTHDPHRAYEGSCWKDLEPKFGILLESERLSDCQLVARDGKGFAVHRAVLAANSSVFAAMFEHDMKEKSSGQCSIKDVDGGVLDALVKFAYTGTLPQLPATSLPELYDAADKYDMDVLRAHCEMVMIGAIDVDTALRFLLFAKERGLQQLKKKAAKFVYEHSDDI